MTNEAKQVWEQMLSLLETSMDILSYDVWIKPIEPLDIFDGKLVLVAASDWGKNEINVRYLPLIRAALNRVNSLFTDVEIISKDQKEKYAPKEETYEIKEEPIVVAPEPLSINLRYNFENFVVGKSNQLAVAAARAVAEEPGVRYNPLFIYGDAGLGKTHLMHAIGNSLRSSNPRLKVLLVSSENLVNDIVKYIGMAKDGQRFRDKYRSVDVLMVDDIQLISRKTSTIEEMFNTFNELYNANKQLVFTSDRHPKDIPDIDDRMRSRFEWGFTADIQPPDLETRIAILRKKAQIQKYNISMDVLSYMAECISGDVRKMEGLLNKVILLSQLNETKPSIDLVKEAIKDYAKKEDDEITADDVIDATCKCFNIKREDLLGKRKTRDIVEPRQICIYVMTEILDLPLTAIGNIFGGRDHTTIMYARDKVAQSMSQPKMAEDVNNVKNMVYKK
ncbi:MAG: chromosomal replication initiator protein DnaA [Clostridiales bacterium]|nr:chromosomal replication initiator protein DnaA [Clostridiales bacterium]